MSSTVAEKLATKSAKSPAAKQITLKLVYIDFWSLVKMAFLLGLSLGIITVVVSFLVFTVLTQTGLLDKLDSFAQGIGSLGDASLSSLVSLPQVMGFALVVAILDTIVTTALGAVVAILYNISVKITGGLVVGFTNR
ncbi:DUF3566 domain-containing protein [Rathayibacter toxicus]|uniref:Membrane protein n=1 Tax=Rathayibacter toxicus TaxID=145458 RepID=A0A0C5BD55_9MICO|nr:DUF3566 domain-containing protein [Rathayibacter toxicus]AJM76919.1 membrane protein [Rathayibacter toxicus]ALS57306.1 hypothetical protein APU90_05590 [Rathayibacter toxicus]KKM45725.1 membrane protein [Rathayibacter toxicus]PPG24817.1 hypothetical protein C5D15_00695 [Rathayibacter toxicus]PPG48272.1 hypothetical protein C5D16_00710 [Rathayibacter toxicus]